MIQRRIRLHSLPGAFLCDFYMVLTSELARASLNMDEVVLSLHRRDLLRTWLNVRPLEEQIMSNARRQTCLRFDR